MLVLVDHVCGHLLVLICQILEKGLIEMVAVPLVEPHFPESMSFAEATTELDMPQSEVFYTLVVLLAEALMSVGMP